MQCQNNRHVPGCVRRSCFINILYNYRIPTTNKITIVMSCRGTYSCFSTVNILWHKVIFVAIAGRVDFENVSNIVDPSYIHHSAYRAIICSFFILTWEYSYCFVPCPVKSPRYFQFYIPHSYFDKWPIDMKSFQNVTNCCQIQETRRVMREVEFK